MRSYDVSIFADYFQFYLQDEAVQGDLSASWTEAATARMLAVAPGVIGVGTARNMDVPVVVKVLAEEPQDDQADWDHVVETSLDVASGRLVIAGCTDYFPDAARIDVSRGCHRIRVSYGALDALSEDGLSGDDHYRVQLWPGTPTDVRILKQRAG